MADPSDNVSTHDGRSPQRLTQTGYRAAVSDIVRKEQGDLTDQDFADVWGQSASTVKTARNRANDLSAVPLLKLGERFGIDALAPVLALVGAKPVPIAAVALTADQIAAMPCNVAGTLPLLIQLLADGDLSDHDVRELDREGVIDCLAKAADALAERRASLQLRSVA